jgi:hypothetical protein
VFHLQGKPGAPLPDVEKALFRIFDMMGRISASHFAAHLQTNLNRISATPDTPEDAVSAKIYLEMNCFAPLILDSNAE